jgi:hypothetical protein
MARIRTIKPEFWTDEDLSSVSAETALLAIALLNYADDDGYFKAHPGLVRAGCMPLRDTSLKVSDMLGSLTEISYIRLGTGSDGKRYGQIINFAKHQVVNRHTKSKIGSLSITWDLLTEDSLSTHNTVTDDSHLEVEMEREMEVEREIHMVDRKTEVSDHGVITRPGIDRGKRDPPSLHEFEKFWGQHPKRNGSNPKPKAVKAWLARIRDGTSPAEMISGAMRYAAYCDAKRITGTEYVMQAATFLGPDLHFTNDWSNPRGSNGANFKPGGTGRSRRDKRDELDELHDTFAFGTG